MKLQVTDGGAARLVELRGDRIAIAATTSAPPGATITLLADDGTQYALKVVGCRRENGRYRIAGRLVNVSREERQRLARLMEP